MNWRNNLTHEICSSIDTEVYVTDKSDFTALKIAATAVICKNLW